MAMAGITPSQSANQFRQNATSRSVVCSGECEKNGVIALTIWRLKHTVTSTVQAVTLKKDGNDSYDCPLPWHHSVWRHMYNSMHAAHKPKSKIKFVTLDKESNISTL